MLSTAGEAICNVPPKFNLFSFCNPYIDSRHPDVSIAPRYI